jgi:hypothetical protein
MTNGTELKSPGSIALRAAGYLPCPRYWLTREQLTILEKMAKENEAEIIRIREDAHEKDNYQWRKKQEMEKAWKKYSASK